MIQQIVEQINSLLFILKTVYSQQSRTGRILLPGSFLFVFCCLCSLLIRLVSAGPRALPAITPSPVFYPTQALQATPTALFGFGGSPFPTLAAPTALPTTPAPSTETQTPTQIVPTATATLVPTSTIPPATATSFVAVAILTVNKPEEYVDIRNAGNVPVDLSGWKLVSETGNQSCPLSGVLPPSEALRIWARKSDTGFSCGFSRNIWNDNQADPAVLYDPQGKEVSRFP